MSDSDGDPYDIEFTGPARRAVTAIPESVAAAVVELIYGPLAADPYRLSKPLREPFDGQRVARRSTYRVRLRIDEATRTVHILDIRGRADAYRP